MRMLRTPGSTLDGVGVLVALAMCAWQGVTALRYALEVPKHDEWLALQPGGFDGHMTWAFLTSFLQEHVVVMTRAVSWANYRCFNGAPIVQVCVNYTFFLAAIALFYRLIRRLGVPGAALLIGATALPMPVDVHAWGFQTHFYGALMLFFALLNALGERGKALWLAVPLVSLCVFTFGSGVLFAAVTVGVCGVLIAWRPEERMAYGATLVGALGSALTYLHLLRAAYPHVTAPENLFHRPDLASYFVRLVAKPFGWQDHWPAIAGSIIALVLTASAIAMVAVCLRRRNVDAMLFTAAVVGILGVCVLISMGRSQYGVVFANDTRNTTYTLFLVPMLWAMQVALNGRRPLCLAVLAGALILPLVPKLDYETPYRAFYAQGVTGKRCLWDYYLGANDGCKDLMPWHDSEPFFDWAWKLDLAFVQEFKQMNPGKPTRYDKKARSSDPQAALSP